MEADEAAAARTSNDGDHMAVDEKGLLVICCHFSRKYLTQPPETLMTMYL